MGLLSKLREQQAAEDTTGIVGGEDKIGGSYTLDGGAYKMTVNQAYLSLSTGGALGLTLDCTSSKGDEFNTTQYITSGKDKGQKTYSQNAQGKKRYMTGYVNAETLAQFATGKSIFDQDEEDMIIKKKDYKTGKETPVTVQSVPALKGAVFVAGIKKEVKNKRVQGNDGNWVDTADTREQNELDKVFNEDGFTVTELKDKAEKPVFIHSWIDTYKDKVIDRTKKVAGTAPTSNNLGGAAEPSGMFKD